ncbi:HAD family hydrolase [soil metagenome]
MDLKGIIFDFDGLIVDTESAVYEGWRELYVEHGHDLVLGDYVACVGTTRDFDYDPAASLDALVGRGLDWDDLHPRKDRRIREMLERAETLPGVRELLAEAADEGVACAVASSSPHAWVDHWLDRLGLVGSFVSVVCRDDVERAKPAPDLFLRAAQDLGCGTGEVVVLEDSRNGLLAALAAEIRCVAVPNQITGGSNFAGAWKRFESLDGVGLRKLAG